MKKAVGELINFKSFKLGKIPEFKKRQTIQLLEKLKRDYDDLKSKIFNLELKLYYDELSNLNNDTLNFIEEDKKYLKLVESYKNMHLELRQRMFGFPANMSDDSAIVKHLREKETELYLMNNCGDSFEQGNYQMDSKIFEIEVLNLFFEKFDIKKEDGWGYITSGGSESNTWGIQNGFKQFPNGILYFSEAAHYSVLKASNSFPHYIIPKVSSLSESIDIKKLTECIEINWELREAPAILLLTWGTTKLGSIDNVKEISSWLKSKDIPFYIHLDAALYGGIPNNQINAPIVPKLEDISVDSIAVSFHKYLGITAVNSVIISRNKGLGNVVSYIGQTDTTTSGSRSFNPFSTLQKLREIFYRSNPDDYSKNTIYFEDILNKHNIKYTREPLSNIFVFNKPSNSICKEFQLSCFKDKGGRQLAHAIIFPYHKKEFMDKLVCAIVNECNIL